MSRSTKRRPVSRELVQSLLPYVGDLGIDTRWLVLGADADVRQTVWRLRQGLQGFSGDDGSLGSAEHRALDRATAPIAQELVTRLRPGDLVLLHDPGPAPLAPALLDAGATVIWRCHCGSETANDSVAVGVGVSARGRRGRDGIRVLTSRLPTGMAAHRSHRDHRAVDRPVLAEEPSTRRRRSHQHSHLDRIDRRTHRQSTPIRPPRRH